MFYTERLMLRALDIEGDKKLWTQWLNDDEFWWSARPDAPRPTSRESVQKFLEKISEQPNLPCFMVCDRSKHLPDRLDPNDDLFLKDGNPRYPAIGFLAFTAHAFSSVNRVAGFGVALGRSHQGAGYGTELLMWAMDYFFGSLGLHKCEIQVMEEDKRAIRCYKRIGFVLEGISRSSYLKHGVWKNMVSMGLLENEWRERQTSEASVT